MDKDRAAKLRKQKYLRASKVIVAGGHSHGTQHIIEQARKKGLPVWVFDY